MIEEYKILTKDKKFLLWKKKNNDSYLCSVFLLKDEEKSTGWQFDYYLPKKHKIASFLIHDEVKLMNEDNIFSKSDKIDEIELNEVKFKFDDVVKLVLSKHKNQRFTKEIIILQSLDSKLLWNISLVTSEFNLFNIKVSAINGKILEETSSSLLQFGTRQ